MKAGRITRSVLVLAALGSVLTAQEAQHGKKDAHPVHKEGAAMRANARELSFQVTGLTQDTEAKAKKALMSLTNHVYVCAACDVEERAPGDCPKCKGALEAEDHPVFSSVQPSASAGSMQLTLSPHGMLRYSELASTLAKEAVKIDAAHFPLPGRARLVVRGVTTEATTGIEKTLTEAKLFEEVKARYDSATNQVIVAVRAGETAPTRAKVEAALAGVKAQLEDIVWGGQPMRS